MFVTSEIWHPQFDTSIKGLKLNMNCENKNYGAGQGLLICDKWSHTWVLSCTVLIVDMQLLAILVIF